MWIEDEATLVEYKIREILEQDPQREKQREPILDAYEMKINLLDAFLAGRKL